MVRKFFPFILSAALVFTLLLGGCGNQEAPDAEGRGADTPSAEVPEAAPPIQVTDPTGNTITLDKPAEKVVVLTASSCEIVYALGAGKAVVGRGEYCDWPAEAAEKPVVQSGADTTIEQIIALGPEVVIMTTMAQDTGQAKQLKDAGIQVYSSDAQNIDDTYVTILQIGALMGKDAEAEAIVSDMRAVFDGFASKQASGTIYFEISPLEFGLWTSGNNTFMNEIAELMGLENIFADVEGWAEVSEEQVLARNPDYILTIGMYYGTGMLPDEEILSRANWQEVTAVKNGKVLSLANNELSRPAPRLAEGAQALYGFVNE